MQGECYTSQSGSAYSYRPSSPPSKTSLPARFPPFTPISGNSELIVMADPLSFAASTTAAIQLAEMVTGLRYSRKKLPEHVQNVCAELELLTKVLQSVQASSENVGPGLLAGLQQSVTECVKITERLYSKFDVGKSKPSIFSRLKWGEKNSSKYIMLLQRHRAAFNHALNDIQLSRAINLQAQLESLYSGRERDSKFRAGRKHLGIFNDTNIEYRIRVLDWLYQEAFDATHVQIRHRRQANTCQWILRTMEFLEWKRSNGKMFWGYGIPGAGKTFVSSKVIDDLLKSSAGNHGVAYIYFNREEQDRQTLDNFLSSLVKQLVCQMPHVSKEIKELHDELQVQQKRPALEGLYSILVSLTKSFTRTFIVCDALDECDQDARRKEFLPLLHRMCGAGMNLFITSQEYPEDIQNFFRESALKIRISAKREDIIRYIEQKIDENPRARRLVEQAQCKEKIVTCLTNCSKGMFLLVRFNVEYICQQTTSRHILAELDRIQNSSSHDYPLDPTYNSIMETLQSQSRNCVDLAFRILSWLVKGQRALMVSEIQTAVSIEPEQHELEELNLPDKETLIDLCAGFATIDESSDTIHLVHPTVREYLLRKSIVPQDAGFQLAMACVTFLSFDVFAGGACNSDNALDIRRDLYPFLDYAAKNLPFHLKECNEESTTQLVLRFLKNPGSIDSYLQAACTSLKHNIQDSGVFSDEDSQNTYTKGQNSLHIAAALGHYSVIRLLWEDMDIDTLDSKGRTAIHVASSEGHESVARLLLQKGANPFIADNDGITALKWAESKGHESLVRSMLQKRADFLGSEFSKRLSAQPPHRDNNISTTSNGENKKSAHTNLSSKVDRYKLETAVYGDLVVHTTYKTDLAARQRKVPVEEKWTRKREIGAGGFGVVLLEEERGGKLRVVKKLPLARRDVDYSRELNTLAKLTDHQHLFVQFLGWYKDSQFLYIAMEYVEFGDLGQYIKDGSARLKARTITSQLLEGIMVLHERQICHRDLKPQNILVACVEPIWVKIADFGVSKREKDTNLHTQLGTGGYLAPEILGLLPRRFGNPRSYTNAVDIWALGCLVHEILTSEIPFAEASFPISCTDISLFEEFGEESIAPQVDMGLLAKYCNGTAEFPIAPLRGSKVSEEGIKLMERLLDLDPSSRMSPAEGLKSLWLLEEEN